MKNLKNLKFGKRVLKSLLTHISLLAVFRNQKHTHLPNKQQELQPQYRQTLQKEAAEEVKRINIVL